MPQTPKYWRGVTFGILTMQQLRPPEGGLLQQTRRNPANPPSQTILWRGVGFCAGTITYPSECGVENERTQDNKLELLVLLREFEDEVALENIVVLPRGDEWEEL